MKVTVEVRSKSLLPALQLPMRARCIPPSSESVMALGSAGLSGGETRMCSFRYDPDTTPVLESVVVSSEWFKIIAPRVDPYRIVQHRVLLDYCSNLQ